MTVAELRVACKAAGLPAYQCGGRRLRKRDLERQLSEATAGTYAVAPAPERPPRSARVPATRRTDADRLIGQLAAMPTTPAEAMALYRVLNGTATAGHNGILRRREAKACRALAERSRTERGRLKWHGRYLRATGGAMT